MYLPSSSMCYDMMACYRSLHFGNDYQAWGDPVKPVRAWRVDWLTRFMLSRC